jgi:hypothetical protein
MFTLDPEQRIICLCGAREACFTPRAYAKLILVFGSRDCPDLPLCQRKVAFPSPRRLPGWGRGASVLSFLGGPTWAKSCT